MMLSGVNENVARGQMMIMKNRGWIEPGKRTGKNGQKFWTRTRYFGVDKSRAREDQQNAALALIGQCISAWRIA